MTHEPYQIALKRQIADNAHKTKAIQGGGNLISKILKEKNKPTEAIVTSKADLQARAAT